MAYEFTPFQQLVHSVPEGTSRFLCGGRGGGKSEAFAQHIGIRALRYGRKAKILYLRQGPYKSLNDFTATLNNLFSTWWGPKNHRLNRSSHTWTTPTGAYIELGILPDGEKGRSYYERTYLGRSFSDILIDEAGQWARPDNLDLLVSNLRAEIPTVHMLGANPGGNGHQWLAQRYIFNGTKLWNQFTIDREVRLGGRILRTARKWISCPSTYKDNPHNGPDYLDNLAESAAHDNELLMAWITGSWKISRGAYFAAAMDNPYIEIMWPSPAAWGDWRPIDWRFWLAYDHGTESPAVCYVMARSPGADGPDGLYYPAESCLALDEYACYQPEALGKAYGLTIPPLSEHVKELAARWQLPAQGVADDATFGKHGHEGGSLVDEYSRCGVVWHKARKGQRAARFVKMKRLFGDCGKIERPGLYVSTKCRYFWQTVPFLVHDPRDPEVVHKCDTDHGLDAMSYGIEGDVVTSSFMRAW